MLTVLLLVAAAVLLAAGYANEQPGLVWVALLLSVLAALTVALPRLLGTVRARRTTGSGPAPAPEAVVTEPVADEVVFVPGRLTFHDPACAAVAGKGTSAATRSQLEAGGMTACRRCLGAAGTR